MATAKLLNATAMMMTTDVYYEGINVTLYDDASEVDDRGEGHLYSDDDTLFAMVILYFKIVINIVGMVGNVVVILLITLCRDLHTAANYHFLNMAVADFILLLENIVRRIGNLMDVDVLQSWNCVPVFLHTVVVQTSSLTLAAVSIDRYKLIVRPLKNLHERSALSVTLSLVAVWIVSFVLHIPIAVFTVQTASYCKTVLPWVHGKLVFGVYSNVVLFYLPTSIVLFCNLCILAKIRRKMPGLRFRLPASKPMETSTTSNECVDENSSKDATNYPSATQSSPQSKTRQVSRRGRSARIVMTVMFAYIAFNLPFYGFYTVALIPGAMSWNVYLNGHLYLAVLLLINSAVNPFIYALMGSKYRKHFRQVVRYLCCSFKICTPSPVSEVHND
ncbi:5-hydroxytryptamine receptor 2A-like [Lytechinus pictus]|uniref:5-hydroxytryptamine receptor 2A-like n=1 Tax=Lytechinus pictus TaxID=7653 RepID=UPI0030BA04D0